MRHKAYVAGKKVPKMYAKPFEVLQFFPERLEEPIHRKKPTVYFLGSQTDFFHGKILIIWVDKITKSICRSPQHKFILLTKRPEYMPNHIAIENVYPYVTICNQAEAETIMPLFLGIKCHFHGICIEPMLGPVDLRPWIEGIDHVIVGCESGSKWRPCYWGWIAGVIEDCEKGKVPLYVKQIRIVDKVVTDPSKFPPYARHRQLPWKVR